MKRFTNGDIVYWCHSDGNGRYSVKWGMVDEQFSDAVLVDYLVPKERRLVDGVPIDDFKPEQRFKKLPKNWTYDTELFTLTWDKTQEVNVDIKNPQAVKEAYQSGLLVKDSTIFHGTIEAEITKEGYRIRKTYPRPLINHIDRLSILPHKLYYSYEEAKQEVNANVQELYRQATLSEYDWSVEQIDKTLNHWQVVYDISNVVKTNYRNWLLEMKNVEDIETRIFNSNIQWKYWKNKQWNYIEL
jgi:hypothetical protein